MSRQPFQPPSRGQMYPGRILTPEEFNRAQQEAYQAMQQEQAAQAAQAYAKHPAQNAYPQNHGYPGYEPPPFEEEPYQATEQPPAPPPSYELDQAQRQQIVTFIHQAMNAALGLQTQLHHFRVRGVQLPADARDQLARLFQDIADTLR